MDKADKITIDRVTNEIKVSFAKMTLEQIEAIRGQDIREINCGLLREVRENAQALSSLNLI